MTRRLGLVLLAFLCSPPAAASEAPADSVLVDGSRTLVPFPFYFYSPETGSGGGASLSVITRAPGSHASARPSNLGLIALYTENRQYTLAINVDRYWSGETWHLTASGGLSEFPGEFYGIGSRTDADAAEDFTPRTRMLALGLERSWRGDWQIGPTIALASQDILGREPEGYLQTRQPPGWDGGGLLAIGLGATRDRRDHVFFPRAGTWVRLESLGASSSLAGDFDYTTHSADLRWYRGLGDEQTWGRPVVALRARLVHSAGTMPFTLLPGLGGANLLRGYYEGRFRERELYALQAELRLGHYKRMGLNLFGEIGDVARRVGEFRIDGVKATYGLGLRVLLSRKEQLHLRADFGMTDEGEGGFYLNFLEAF